MLEIKQSKPPTKSIPLLILLLLIAISYGCKEKEVKASTEKVINVYAAIAEKKPVRPFVGAIGTLNPFEEVIVSSEVDGILQEVRGDEGTVVAKGTILAAIDDMDYNLEVKRAEAALRQAQATLSNTKLEYQRKEALFNEALVTRQQFDDVSTRLSLAEADVERAMASLSLAKQKQIKTKIPSPLAGMIKEKKVSMGNYVRNGTPLFVIIQNNPLKLDFTLPEKSVGRLRTGQDVLFQVNAFPEKEFKGKVSIIYPGLDEKTRTLQVEARVPNPDGVLKPGFFANVTLYTDSERDTILVPVTAILYEGEKARIFIIEGNKAKERQVKTGTKYGDLMEITEGLREGENIVVVGQQNLSDGAKVNVAR